MGIAIFYGLALIAGLASFVCFILVLVQMFKNAGAGLGIVGIITCGIAAFIWGWIKAKQLNLSKIMLIWTAAIVVSIVGNVGAGTMAAKAMAENPEFQKMIEEAQKAAQEAQQQATQPAPAPQN